MPLLALPVNAQEPAPPGPEALLQTMKTNVDRISPSLEHQRWTANIALWEARLAHPGALAPAEVTAMRAHFRTIVEIVGQLVGPEERARWDLNRDMWSAVLRANGTPSDASLREMRAKLRAMQANVSRITAPGESERWTVNCNLWKAALAP
jgi:hypothetical protein